MEWLAYYPPFDAILILVITDKDPNVEEYPITLFCADSKIQTKMSKLDANKFVSNFVLIGEL